MLVRVPDTDTGTPTAARRPSLAARAVMAVIGAYQRTALLRSPRCRFHPTCSQYAVDSVRVHGVLRGGAYSLARIGRCHPWHPGGLDPVKPPTPGRSDS